MINDSKLSLVFDYVKENPMKTATQIAIAIGINELTAHRHLSGGRGRLTNGLFERVKVCKKRIDKGGRVRGSYHYLYSISSNIKQEPKKVALKKVIKRDPITEALYGVIS